MQTSLKRCGLKFPSRKDMSAKFPGGGEQDLFSSKSKSNVCYRLLQRPQRTECKYFLKDLSFNPLQDRICLQNSLGGGGSKPILSHPSIMFRLKIGFVI